MNLTAIGVRDIGPRMGRPKLWPESINLTLAGGWKDRISAVLRNGEDRLSFIRLAIEREVVDRETAQARARAKTKPSD